MARVVLAMSGGVDSSVAAHLLLAAGHEVIGVFMRHGEPTQQTCESDPAAVALPVVNSHKQGCCTAADAADARRIADRLGIRFYALNLQAEFREIIDYFVDEYVGGRTPNPCVMCNNWIKFGRLFDYADSVGAEYVATGHYARLNHDGNRASLHRGIDTDKDQSYVLFGISPSLLPRMLLPVGGYRKTEIRGLADKLGMRVANKPDSQEICFVAAGEHARFVHERRERDTAGEITTLDGTVVGRHAGIEAFTIGQRKGLGVALGAPQFVVKIDARTNRVVIGDRDALACNGLAADRCNWLVRPPQGEFRCEVQIRYNAKPVPATCYIDADERLRVRFAAPQRGVAPGQAVVCYREDHVLGGGWIRVATPTDERIAEMALLD